MLLLVVVTSHLLCTAIGQLSASASQQEEFDDDLDNYIRRRHKFQTIMQDVRV